MIKKIRKRGNEHAGIIEKKKRIACDKSRTTPCNNIEITVLDVKGDQVKLGISAPREVPVYRKEIYLQIQEANKAATQADGIDAVKDLF